MKKLFKSTKGLLFLLISFCLFLWMIRISMTKSLFFGFLIWNLFLAYVPYFISSIIKEKMQNSSTFKLIIALIINWCLYTHKTKMELTIRKLFFNISYFFVWIWYLFRQVFKVQFLGCFYKSVTYCKEKLFKYKWPQNLVYYH